MEVEGRQQGAHFPRPPLKERKHPALEAFLQPPDPRPAQRDLAAGERQPRRDTSHSHLRRPGPASTTARGADFRGGGL